MEGGTGRSSRKSLAAHCRAGAGLGIFGALLGLAACSTYGDDLKVSAVANGAAGGAGDGVGGAGTVIGGSSAAQGGSSPVGAGANSGGSAMAGDAGADDGGASGAPSGGYPTGGHGGAPSGGTGATGGGGASTTGGGGASTTGGGSQGGTSGIDMIDDFEADDPAMQVILNNGRNGFWYAFHDATAAGVQTFGISALSGGNVRSGSSYALHMTAKGFTDYGAGFGADFVNVSKVKAPYDVSAYKGIRFYAKVAASSQTSLKVLIPTTYSDIMGGKCTEAAGVNQCTDHLFCAVNNVTTAWALYECDFANLRQVGFGLKQASLDPKSVYSVQFSFLTVTLAADVWVDDVAFVLK